MLLAALLELPAPNHHALQLLSCPCSSKMGGCGHTQCHRRAVRQALWALKCVGPTDPYLAQVGILTDDESILSTQLQHHWCQGQSCSLPTVSQLVNQSGLRGTRERDISMLQASLTMQGHKQLPSLMAWMNAPGGVWPVIRRGPPA